MTDWWQYKKGKLRNRASNRDRKGNKKIEYDEGWNGWIVMIHIIQLVSMQHQIPAYEFCTWRQFSCLCPLKSWLLSFLILKVVLKYLLESGHLKRSVLLKIARAHVAASIQSVTVKNNCGVNFSSSRVEWSEARECIVYRETMWVNEFADVRSPQPKLGCGNR